MALAGIAAAALQAAPIHAPPHAPAHGPLHGARQLVLVTTEGWDADHGMLRRYRRDADDAAWHEAGASRPVAIGRHGSAWGIGLHAPGDAARGPRKREGDGRSPAGAFALDTAFGYADAAATALPYAPMRRGHYCMDVPDSPLYNRIVDARDVGADAVAGSTEPMRLDLHRDGDPRYRLGIVIAHNPGNLPGAGSCIFVHLWRSPGEATAGCTAMDEAGMRELLAWLDPRARPRFVLLPAAEYRRLARDWALPQGAG
ncbi:hypothetical protein B1992_05200 [Pseudoxanthomonas broegbernensis]|uniref:YkuD domain-containing protein n=1 Tax=Pseudoxanthomonas broegbernensis TaxID=83619 RepID=A0A7V8GP47_9GAMM|nr:hypothetical protein B1992_05200 [Pseudoxanthomonas broegbernensis]